MPVDLVSSQRILSSGDSMNWSLRLGLRCGSIVDITWESNREVGSKNSR